MYNKADMCVLTFGFQDIRYAAWGMYYKEINWLASYIEV